MIGAGAPARPAPWPAMAAALAANELRLALRRGEGLLITFVIPVGVLLVFSALDTGGATPAVDRLLPGSIALAVIAAAFVSLAITTGFERQYGVIKRLGGSPAGSSAVVAAKTAAVIVVELVQLVLLVGIAAGALGWAAGPTASAPVTLAALVLGTIAFAGLGPADRRDPPRRGDARAREPPVPRLPRARRHRPAARPPARRRGRGRRRAPAGGADRRPSRSASGTRRVTRGRSSRCSRAGPSCSSRSPPGASAGTDDADRADLDRNG